MLPMEVETLRRIEENMGIRIGGFGLPSYDSDEGKDCGEEEEE